MIVIDFKNGNKKNSSDIKKDLDDSSKDPLKLGELSDLMDRKFKEQRKWLNKNKDNDSSYSDNNKKLRKEALSNLLKKLPKD